MIELPDKQLYFRHFSHYIFVVLYAVFLLYTKIGTRSDYNCCSHIHGGNSRRQTNISIKK